MLKRLVLFLMLASIAVACSGLVQSPTISPSETPDAFSLTVTQLIFEATSGTSDARGANLRMTDEVYATVMQATNQAESMSATAYWETQGVTSTPDPFALTATIILTEATGTVFAQAELAILTYEAFFRTETQIAETAIANNCEESYIDYLYQHRQIDFTETPVDVLSFDIESEGMFFDCPDILDIPDLQRDFTVDVIFPGNEMENINDYVAQAILLLPDYPFEETTLGTDNLALYVKANSYQFQAWHTMTFSLSDMLSTLDDGLEAEALLEALGGVEAISP